MLFRNNNRHECAMNGLLDSKLEVGHEVTFGSGRRVRSGSVRKSSSFCRAALWQSVAVTTTLTCVRRAVAGVAKLHRASANKCERKRTNGDSLCWWMPRVTRVGSLFRGAFMKAWKPRRWFMHRCRVYCVLPQPRETRKIKRREENWSRWCNKMSALPGHGILDRSVGSPWKNPLRIALDCRVNCNKNK